MASHRKITHTTFASLYRITHFLYASEVLNKFLIKLRCIRPTKFFKKIHLLPKRIEFKLTERSRPDEELTKKINSADVKYI